MGDGKTLKVLVTGTRYAKALEHEKTIWNAMLVQRWRDISKDVTYDNFEVIHGGARGVDYLAGAFARHFDLQLKVFEADWKTHKKAAGFIRNQQMVDYGADVCLAFPISGGDNKGTFDCMQRAVKAGIPLVVTVLKPLEIKDVANES